MRYECKFTAPSKFAILLTVIRSRVDPENWEWCVANQLDRSDMYRGTANTRLSAQVSAQLAYERWLHMNRSVIGSSNPDFYDWERAGGKPW